jgi:hypothetical protein
MAGNQSLLDSDSAVQTCAVGDDHSVLTETPPGRWRGFAADRVMFFKHRFPRHERDVQKPGIVSCTLMSSGSPSGITGITFLIVPPATSWGLSLNLPRCGGRQVQTCIYSSSGRTSWSWDICPEAWGICPIKLGMHAPARSGRLPLDRGVGSVVCYYKVLYSLVWRRES